MKTGIVAIAALAVVAAGLGMEAKAGDGVDRYVKKHHHPAGPVVVVAEGEDESRSAGSYSVRVYSNAQPQYPTDDFVCGLVRPRDGTVEGVMFADINRDGVPDIIVTIRCVGTGSYLSAEGFTFKDNSLVMVAAVSGLPKDADCITALKEKMNTLPNQAPDTARKLADPQL